LVQIEKDIEIYLNIIVVEGCREDLVRVALEHLRMRQQIGLVKIDFDTDIYLYTVVVEGRGESGVCSAEWNGLHRLR